MYDIVFYYQKCEQIVAFRCTAPGIVASPGAPTTSATHAGPYNTKQDLYGKTTKLAVIISGSSNTI